MIQLVYYPETQVCDLGRNGKNLLDDPTLATACLISLFTRRLAAPDDELPTPGGSREGWWADGYNDVPGDLIGSRLWLLGRSKATADVPPLAKDYCLEAFAWMLEDGVASLIECETEWHTQVNEDPLLAIAISIYKPGDPTRWNAVWLANLALL